MARKSDEIRIRGLRVFAHHGVFEEETRLGQMFVVNATLYTSTRQGGLADALEQTISYADVCVFLTEYLQKNTWKLLEAAVEHACRALLLKFPLIHEVELELEKPSAPIPLPFDSVSVCVRRGWHRAFVALGSNMGDKQGYLDGAVEALRADECVRVKKVSAYRVTEPYGGVEQDDFLNAAMEIETLYDPEELLDALHVLEQAARRERLVHWGPRTLDLDILFYDDLVQDDPALILPHPDLQNRDFVLGPMVELAPNFVHPVLHKTMRQLLDALSSDSN
ncbi:MAG: 2-amino-4-hydroxy-6-hydroxymethyldihydropteridine diphosphokinase [Aristaeellaceae bacterium]|nr:2-amino-4-hydroxy-6-hydroxymethyldihydropteridine diphosphokinase [Eubacteriales bacterium]